jgi:hypothetical protein
LSYLLPRGRCQFVNWAFLLVGSTCQFLWS